MKIPEGFTISGINCGIKRKSEPDLGLICADKFAKAIGFFTGNVNPSYSVSLCRRNINNPIKAVLVNSGNANCYLSRNGIKNTEKITGALAKKLGVKRENILIASTGIIGKKLPSARITAAFPGLIDNLGKSGKDFSRSILTTDTTEKVSYAHCPFRKGGGHILGFAKGSGMIFPNMGTMLSFILTDVYTEGKAFRKLIKEAVGESFNSISVDGCTSTNDTVLLLSSKRKLLKYSKDIKEFSQKIKKVFTELAKKVVKDGEGATKFITVHIKGARNKTEARRAGFCIANNPLFKCAMYGENPNWGRIISALGQEGIKTEDKAKINFSSLKRKNIQIKVDLKRGSSEWKVYTCDFSPGYIKINAEYS
ncbi:MAG: bifunctional glutamate N-acetyltransferase/amino-acid acetyltransferase ArgJ [Candidatus Omnitrophica bacterium]|nr:bifunctional glutamate N-acetyltransferase/amino-acid acetyltransferase ArgJ [Candidatus Omnitrophota bacterium]MBD3269310.1 bifunctional glutamate N-acetyltransferase/amino-acid acetyltransferase ArgJ [Candidatus Omnitrophota bacterium]